MALEIPGEENEMDKKLTLYSLLEDGNEATEQLSMR
jgi:hypothetical protein